MFETMASLVQRFIHVIVPSGIACAVLLIGLLVRKILFFRLKRWAQKSATQIDDIILGAIQGPSVIWCFMLAVYVGVEYSRVSEEIADGLGKVLAVLGMISVTLVVSAIVSRMIETYADRFDSALPVTSLTRNISRIVIYTIGILIILNSLGIAIGPILATLGVGGLAVALALQDTLSNLFSGFHIIMARQMKVGDFIRLDTGQEGYIIDINWRTTQIRMLPNNVVLIPNAKLAQAVVVDYYLPEKELAVLVEAGVHYDSDLKKVERVTVEVGRQVMKEVTGGVPGFEPFIRYHTFSDFSIDFTVILRAKEFVDQYLIKHEFIKRLHERYKKEGIVIPYPIRTIVQEKS